jgi:hypothetical protein
MLSQRIDEVRANIFGERFAVTHRIARVGIDHVEGGLLVGGLLQVGFEDADVLHGRVWKQTGMIGKANAWW